MQNGDFLSLCHTQAISIHWYTICSKTDMNEKIKVLENDRNQQTDDFYLKFKERLEQTHSFPSEYIFKCIVPSEQSTIAKLHSIFSSANPSVSTRDSKNGKYTSMTIKVRVNDANDVVIYYRQAAVIDGIVML